jgi:RNase P subunit RPR2
MIEENFICEKCQLPLRIKSNESYSCDSYRLCTWKCKKCGIEFIEILYIKEDLK